MSFLGAEWTYLLRTRVVAGSNNAFTFVRLKYGNNATDTVSGVVIYPDDFSFADAGVGAMTFGVANPTQIDIDSWRALETAGCVFLPANRAADIAADGTVAINEKEYSVYWHYWSATTRDASLGQDCYANFFQERIGTTNTDRRYTRECVRLVQDL